MEIRDIETRISKIKPI